MARIGEGRPRRGRGGMRGGLKRSGGVKRGGAYGGTKRIPDTVLPRGVKRRHLDKVDSYEYSLPDNYENEDIDESYGGVDVWDEPQENEYDSDPEAMSDDGEDLITLDQLWDNNEKEEREEKSESTSQAMEEEKDAQMHGELLNNIKAITKAQGIKSKKHVEIVDKRVESEHNIKLSTFDNLKGTASLSIPDLISRLTPTSADVLKKSVISHAAPPSADTATLLPPMQELEEARLRREAAYKVDAKMLTTKWQDIVQENRRAPQLNFVDQSKLAIQNQADAAMENFKANTPFEKDLESILHESGQDTTLVPKYDELPLNQLTPEQVAMRTAELRKMKRLVSYEVEKATRKKRIHSKTFRKIHGKERRANENKVLMEYLATNPDAATAEVQKMDMKRIEERITLKHKNTSRWVRDNLKRGKNIDPVSRQAIEEQLARGRELTKKMQSIDSDDSADEFYGKDEEENAREPFVDVEDDVQAPLTEDEQRRKRLAALTGDPNIQLPTKGLFAVKFMKRALDRTITEAEKRKNRVDDYEEGEEEEKEKEAVGQIQGRKMIGSVQPTNPAAASSSSSKQLTLNGELVPQVSVGHKARVSGPINTSKEIKNKPGNELDVKLEFKKKIDSTSSQLNKTDTQLHEESYAASPAAVPSSVDDNLESNPWMSATETVDTATNGDTDTTMAEIPKSVAAGTQKEKSSKKKKEKVPEKKAVFEVAPAKPLREEGEDSESEDYDSTNEQSELLRRAFAEDDVVEEYIRENTKLKPTSVALSMPGWGAWANEDKGKQTPKKNPLQSEETAQKPAQTQEKKPAQNQDKKPTQKQDQKSSQRPSPSPSQNPPQKSQKSSQNHSQPTSHTPSQQNAQYTQNPQKKFTSQTNKTNTTNKSQNDITHNTNKTNTLNTPAKSTNKTNDTKENKKNTGTQNNIKKPKIQMKRKNTESHPIYMHQDKAALTVPAKYQVQRLPSTFETEEEYVRDIRAAVGKEWTPALAHAAITAPRIVTRAGMGIEPIALTLEQQQKYKVKADAHVKKYHKERK